MRKGRESVLHTQRYVQLLTHPSSLLFVTSTPFQDPSSSRSLLPTSPNPHHLEALPEHLWTRRVDQVILPCAVWGGGHRLVSSDGKASDFRSEGGGCPSWLPKTFRGNRTGGAGCRLAADLGLSPSRRRCFYHNIDPVAPIQA